MSNVEYRPKGPFFEGQKPEVLPDYEWKGFMYALDRLEPALVNIVFMDMKLSLEKQKELFVNLQNSDFGALHNLVVSYDPTRCRILKNKIPGSERVMLHKQMNQTLFRIKAFEREEKAKNLIQKLAEQNTPTIYGYKIGA